MKLNKIFILTMLLFLSAQVFAENKLTKCGIEWINIHKGNTDVVGIYVQQSPDNIEDEADYIGKHPAMIIYVFKSGRAHTVTYTPTGQIQDGAWWSTPKDHWVRKLAVKTFNLDKRCAYWVAE